jgi:hypothetical protein
MFPTGSNDNLASGCNQHKHPQSYQALLGITIALLTALPL